MSEKINIEGHIDYIELSSSEIIESESLITMALCSKKIKNDRIVFIQAVNDIESFDCTSLSVVELKELQRLKNLKSKLKRSLSRKICEYLSSPIKWIFDNSGEKPSQVVLATINSMDMEIYRNCSCR